MNLVTLYFIRPDRGDETISVSVDDKFRSVYQVVFHDGDLPIDEKSSFYLNEAGLMRYLADVFDSLDYDIDPFTHVQISTAIHPTVLYTAEDFSYPELKLRVEDMIIGALRTKVHSS